MSALEIGDPMESACKSFELLLSAYADGEVNGAERAHVELHLAGCDECRARLADLKALSSALSARLVQRTEEADFSGFADAVMRRVTPERPGLLERMRVAWAEVLTYHRTAVISSLATAAVTLLIAVPVAWKLASSRPEPEVVLRELILEDPNVQPVVMQMGDGRTLIMLVHRPDESGAGKAATPDFEKVQPPSGGDL